MTAGLSPEDAVRHRLHENENNLADMLVRRFGLSLKEAHQIIAGEKSKKGSLPPLEEFKSYMRWSIDELREKAAHLVDEETELDEVSNTFVEMQTMTEKGAWKAKEFGEPEKVRFCIKAMYNVARRFFGTLDTFFSGTLGYGERLKAEIEEQMETAKMMALPNAKFLINRNRKYMELPLEFKFVDALEKEFFDRGAKDPKNPEHLREFVDIGIMYSVTEHQAKKLPRMKLKLRSLEDYLKSGDVDFLVKLARPGPHGYLIPVNVRPEELKSPKRYSKKSESHDLSREDSKIINHITEHGSIIARDTMKLLKCSKSTARRRLEGLKEAGVLTKIKSGKVYTYILQ